MFEKRLGMRTQAEIKLGREQSSKARSGFNSQLSGYTLNGHNLSLENGSLIVVNNCLDASLHFLYAQHDSHRGL